MTAVPKRKLTPAEYLAIERQAAFKSEYYDGEMFPLHPDGLRGMAGASPNHNAINENLSVEIGGRLKGGPCRTYSRDMRLLVSATGLYTYPDLMIVCGAAAFDRDQTDVLVNPRVVIEVLSDSTERYDRGVKFRHYQQIESLQEYVLVSQDEPVVDRFVRQPDGTWVLTTFAGLSAELHLATVPVRLPLAAIYADVTFAEGGRRGPPTG